MGSIPKVIDVDNAALSLLFREAALKKEVAAKKEVALKKEVVPKKAVAASQKSAKVRTKPSRATQGHPQAPQGLRKNERVLPEYRIAQNPPYPWGAGAKVKHEEVFSRVKVENQGPGPKDDDYRVENQDIRLTNLHLNFFNHDRRVRFVFTNENSKTESLKLTGIYVGKQTGERVPDVIPGTQRKVTFGGKDTVEILPGKTAVSDYIDLDFVGKRPANASATVALSYRVEGKSGPISWYSFGSGLELRSFLSPSNQHSNTAASDAPDSTAINSTLFVSEADVVAPREGFSVHVISNSIGAGEATEREDSRIPPGAHAWPTRLREKLGNTYRYYSVNNTSRPGNQWMRRDDSGGEAGKIAAKDLIKNNLNNIQAGDFLIVASGTNDIRFGIGMNVNMKDTGALKEAAKKYIDALKETEKLCKDKGVIFIAATVPSAKGEHLYDYGKGDPLRLEINKQIRKTFGPLHVLDIDKETTKHAEGDPADGALDPKYVNHLDKRRWSAHLVPRSGDNVHPNADWHERVAALALKLIDLHTPNPRRWRLSAGIARKRPRTFAIPKFR